MMLSSDEERVQKIDSLYALRLDQHISLPLLVVAGDQSSGKSSVLEALTGLPLPRDQTLCTRFPTQIIFKRSPAESIEVTINSTDESKSRHVRSLKTLDATTLVEVLREACQILNLPYAGELKNDDQLSFTKDVLKIECSGPKYEHFGIVDLPGIFRTSTPGQTDKEDMALVREMVEEYLESERSIILAVIPANHDFATQEVVQIAEDADPNRKRTLGVITKPDLIDKGAEEKVITQVCDSQGLGYNVICNRNHQDTNVSIEERNRNEIQFFQYQPWMRIPPERAGVEPLRRRLEKLLADVTRDSFTGVMEDILNQKEQTSAALKELGEIPLTPSEQRAYLVQLASDFQIYSAKATDAYYSRDECFRSSKNFRLATKIAELNTDFSELVYRKGVTFDFSRKDYANSDDEEEEEEDEQNLETDAGSEQSSNESSEPPALERTELPLELRKIFRNRPSPVAAPADDIITWIKDVHKSSRGFEVSSTRDSVLRSLFHTQAANWPLLAYDHVTTVITEIYKFLRGFLEFLFRDNEVCGRLWSLLRNEILEAFQKALAHLEFLSAIELKGNLITMNHYYSDNLQKARMRRVERSVRSSLAKTKTWNSKEDEPLVRLKDVINSYVSNEEQEIFDLYDELHAYYKVARKRFVDSVCMQVIDYFLVRQGPLQIFGPARVSRLTDEQLRVIFQESPEKRMRREALNKKAKDLDSALQILGA